MRLDAYMAEHYPEYSRSTWQKYIKQGSIKVNGKITLSPKQNLGEDDQVLYNIVESEQEKIAIPIIYEDKNVLVINKPAGILSHAKGVLTKEFSVADFAKPYLSYKTNSNRAGIVHRLDRDTSGVMILAKNETTAAMLQKQFANRKVKKCYEAVAKGELEHQEANIDLPIERNPKMPSQFRVGSGGKQASTHYKVLQQSKSYSLLELKPETGRTHQLRVHLAYINAPILGDRIYGKKADRLYLHAKSLEITIPEGQRKVFVSPRPGSFNLIMQKK